MVFVISKYDDYSTSDVITWVRSKGQTVVRINNYEDVAYMLKYHGEELTNPQSDFMKSITGVWFRRCPHFAPSPLGKRLDGETKSSLLVYYKSEHTAIYNYLSKLLASKRWLNNDDTSAPSKIDQLSKAVEAGLLIPEYKIVGNKQTMITFWEKCGRMAVVKPIQDAYHIPTKSGTYLQFTYLLKETDFKDLPDLFFPCMMQKAIDKNIEIRSFYLDGKFYSMGIVSTMDRQTSVDFRRYNDIHPNRRVPFQLPQDIEKKLSRLMKSLQLNCGSFDLILDNQGDYYFLEVNPVGQFGMVSYPCNYYLEREIANYITQEQA